MAEEKVYTPEVIEQEPFPGDVDVSQAVTQVSSGSGEAKTVGAEKTKQQEFPTKKIAVEVLSSALNTKSRRILQEFNLQQSGGFRIGEYDPGNSGDVAITPSGITARDVNGVTSFALDGTTGSAVFKGTIQADSLIGGMVDVGNNRVVIDGENRRILINDGDNDRILIGFHKDGF